MGHTTLNCTNYMLLIRKYHFVDGNVFRILVKQWLQDLKDDMEEQLQAQFMFKRDLVGSLKQIYCNLCSSYSPMIDGFTPCQVKVSCLAKYLIVHIKLLFWPSDDRCLTDLHCLT